MGLQKVAVFGSYVRGEEAPESDIDILVEFAEPKSLLTLENIELELSDYLGIKVDLLTEKSISPYLIDEIRKEVQRSQNKKKWLHISKSRHLNSDNFFF